MQAIIVSGDGMQKMLPGLILNGNQGARHEIGYQLLLGIRSHIRGT